MASFGLQDDAALTRLAAIRAPAGTSGRNPCPRRGASSGAGRRPRALPDDDALLAEMSAVLGFAGMLTSDR